ncbi:VTT domain-containing protein [Pelagibacteraceae bacterium]|nr:VTT domain-containing protein [Pelagibacteraceae bacterium]
MSKKLKLFLGISYLFILVAFLYFIFLKIDINRLNDFSYYKELQVGIDVFIGENLYLNLLKFFIFTVIWVVLLGFGLPILMIAGILFGKWIGTLVSVTALSLGALLLYIIAKFFFIDLVNKLLEKKFSNFVNIFKKNEFFYFFIFRLVGGLGIPFALQNVLPVILNIKKINYFIASFLGFIPSMFIFVSVGSGLNNFIKESDSFSLMSLIASKEIYIPIIIFIIFIIISGLIKKLFFNVAS